MNHSTEGRNCPPKDNDLPLCEAVYYTGPARTQQKPGLALSDLQQAQRQVKRAERTRKSKGMQQRWSRAAEEA